jgi:hypothetical protein
MLLNNAASTPTFKGVKERKFCGTERQRQTIRMFNADNTKTASSIHQYHFLNTDFKINYPFSSHFSK